MTPAPCEAIRCSKWRSIYVYRPFGELCSQSTISRLENLPDARALLRHGPRHGRSYWQPFQRVPKRITLDIDDTFDAVHGGQGCGCSSHITTNTAFSRLSCSMAKVASSLLPSSWPNGPAAARSAPSCAACCARSAPTGPRPRSYCAPTVIIANWRFYLVPGQRSRLYPGRRADHDIAPAYRGSRGQHGARLEDAPNNGKARRFFKEFLDGAASWSVERIIARVEAGATGTDTRFIATNLGARNARAL